MNKFKASRLTSDNTIFPDEIEIDAVNVTFYKGKIIGFDKTVVPRSSISSVHLDCGIVFADIIIETFGGMTLKANGFTRSDAKAIVRLLSTH